MSEMYKKIAAFLALFLLAILIFLSCYLIVVYLKWGLVGCIIFLFFLFIFPALPHSNLNGVILRLIFWAIRTLKDTRGINEKVKPKDCPSDKVLIQYIVGKLKESKRSLLSQHIDTCNNCQATIKQLKIINELKSH